MTHLYQQYREKHPGQKKAKDRVRGYASGGSVSADASIGKKAISLHAAEHKELKAEGKKDGGRLDKYARGGKAKGRGGKKGNTKINILVAPGKDKDAAPGLPPPGLGAAPPPMPPKMPLGPPPGGPMGGPPAPGMPPMKRGGKIGMSAGADSGEGRLQKAKTQKGK